MQKRHKNRIQYFNESSETCERYYFPFIQNYIECIDHKDFSVLEVGCGEGGNLRPFAKLGVNVVGIDSYKPRIDEAKEFFAEHGLNGNFIHADIFAYKQSGQQFDLIIMHDVIEHIANKESLMCHLKGLLKETGLIFIAFPPWQMPFGGHQQMINNKIISHCPYIHLLPIRLYRFILKKIGETEGNIGYMLDLCKTGLSIEKFKKLALNNKYEIVNYNFYFINPHYEAKFGFKPRLLPSFIGKIPYVRNFITSSCFWLIRFKK